jgi:hypothetical protein
MAKFLHMNSVVNTTVSGKKNSRRSDLGFSWGHRPGGPCAGIVGHGPGLGGHRQQGG